MFKEWRRWACDRLRCQTEDSDIRNSLPGTVVASDGVDAFNRKLKPHTREREIEGNGRE